MILTLIFLFISGLNIPFIKWLLFVFDAISFVVYRCKIIFYKTMRYTVNNTYVEY